MIPYTATFRNRMVARLVGPHAISATALGKETGLAQATLSRWRKEASKLRREMPDDEAPPKKQPQEWTPEEKLQIVLESSTLSEGELGVFLRGKGIHEALLTECSARSESRCARVEASGARRSARHRGRIQAAAQRESREMRELRRELKRKDKALAETAALIVLREKVQAIWGAEDDDTDPTNEE